jgi:hypothetical protein
MDDKDRAIFSEMNQTLKKIQEAMIAPKSRFQRIVDFLVSAVAISGGVFIADQIIKWIRGY